MDLKNRYYTETDISSLVINSFECIAPESIIDLGIGQGSLAFAAVQKWKYAKLYGADVDRKALSHTKEKIPGAKLFAKCAINGNILKPLQKATGEVDVAVCNPPYELLKNKKIYRDILKRAGFADSCEKTSRLTSDIIFLAQNINILRDGGNLAIILPDTPLTGNNFYAFRVELLLRHCVYKIIQLPSTSFQKTEAMTHVLYLRKNTPQIENVPIYSVGQAGDISVPLYVNKADLAKRMDYSFFKNLSERTSHNSSGILASFCPKIFRGNRSKKELETNGSNFLHTSDLSVKPKCLSFNKSKSALHSPITAKTGDIVISRVGKRCLGRVAYVKRGEVEISDCIICIRVARHYRKYLWDFFSSPNGIHKLQAISHGVCAKFITKQDILNIDIDA